MSGPLPHVTGPRARFAPLLPGAASALCLLAGLAPRATARAPLQDDGPSARDLEFFEARVRPLLVEHCVECHAGARPKAGLRLDSPAGIRAGGVSGGLLDPLHGALDGDAPRLLEAVGYEDPELQMPPDGKLGDGELEILADWVARGLPLPEQDPADAAEAAPEFDLEARLDHWSWQPVAPVPTPAVADAAWAHDDLDRFVLARLEAAGLRPAPPVSRRAWLRRVTFDLTGLPPTPDELADFLADGEAGAAERVVDRLLASPAHAEAWARHWLDLVRYAETKGHEYDFPLPNAWQYRDYLVRALEANVPYDQLLVEHVAGDLLDEPRRDAEGRDESVLGTGFWFLMEEVHAPVDPRKDECDRLAGQVDTFGKAFLGLTVACARCHDHKFDAISQEDFHGLTGYLMSSSYRQVRFESEGVNARVRDEVEDLRARWREPAAERVLAGLLGELDAAAPTLRAVASLWRGEGPDDLAPPPGASILLDDFEHDGWAPWTATGEAFGDGPLVVADAPSHMGPLDARGARSVNSYAMRDSDRPTGTLTSPVIEVAHDHLHFLVAGGDLPGTVVQLLLLDADDPDAEPEVVREARGVRTNLLRPTSWDVSELRGRTVRVRLVDEESGGWGQIAADHFVWSDDPGPEALDEVWDADRARLELRARTDGVDVEALAAWLALLEASDASTREDRGARPDDARTMHVRLDARDPRATWLREGPTFEHLPDAGTPRLQHDATWPVRFDARGLVADPAWRGLTLAPGTEREGSDLDWVQAGRTAITPTFTLDTGVLHYRVRGRGKVAAIVDAHRMIKGPLHLDNVRSLDTGGEWRWVRHDVSKLAGHRAVLEFSPDGGEEPFSLLEVLEEATPRDAPRARAVGRLATDAAAGGPTLRARDDDGSPARPLIEPPRHGAAWDAAWARTTLRRLRDALEHDPAARDALMRALWPAGPPEAVREDLAPWLEAEAALFEGVRWTSATAPALRDGTGTDDVFLARGNANSPRDVVPRRFLTALGGEPVERARHAGSGRLALARQLVEPDNPLTARVAVNRAWHHLFGQGIVVSVDDFGAMGRPPTHPELLDRLAADLVVSGWDTRALLRRLVLSSTYRMGSSVDPRARELDPNNALRHHHPVRRLTAEALRDGILAVSGGLDPERFGPSVPIHLRADLDGRGKPAVSGPVDGRGRRSLYLSVRRNFPEPFLTVFDLPGPAFCVGDRAASNVPAQSLALLNDPFVLGEARRWAEGSLGRAPELDPDERLRRWFLRALAREPDEAERAELRAFLGDEPDVDAWADVAHVIFNLEEFRFLE